MSEREALRGQIAQALIAAAHRCDGQCGLEERECLAAHPITMVGWSEPARTEGCVVESRVPALVDVAMAAVRAQPSAAEATVDRVQEWLAGWGPRLPADAREPLTQALSDSEQDSRMEP